MSNYMIAARSVLRRRKRSLSYSELGELLGIPARAVGQVLKGLAKHGYRRLCSLVIYKKDLI